MSENSFSIKPSVKLSLFITWNSAGLSKGNHKFIYDISCNLLRLKIE